MIIAHRFGAGGKTSGGRGARHAPAVFTPRPSLVLAAFLLTATWLIVNALMERPAEAGISSACGYRHFPFYFGWRRVGARTTKGF